MEKFINTLNGLFNDYMSDEDKEYTEEITKMFSEDNNLKTSDEELALHIIHKFNIDRDTLESMPAFNENLKPIFGREKGK